MTVASFTRAFDSSFFGPGPHNLNVATAPSNELAAHSLRAYFNLNLSGRANALSEGPKVLNFSSASPCSACRRLTCQNALGACLGGIHLLHNHFILSRAIIDVVSHLQPKIKTLRVAHGVLMTIGWGVLIPLGVIAASSLKSLAPTWCGCYPP